MAIETPNILGQFLQGQQAGQDQRRKRTLSDYLQPALGGDKNALSQIYGADADTGLQVQGMVQKQAGADREQKMGDLEMTARAWRAATPEMRQQLYPSVVELTESVLPQFAGKIPRDYSPAFEANIDKFLAGFVGNEQEQFTLSPGSARYDASGRQIVAQPFAPERPDFQLSPDGTQWLPKPTVMPQVGPQQHPQMPQGGDPFAGLHSSVPGLRVTSQFRTPEENARLPNSVPNSFHLTNQAIDLGKPSPEQRVQIDSWAAQNGYEVIANYKDGHVHLEPRGKAPQSPFAAAGPSAIPIAGATPRGKASFTQLMPQEVAQLGLPVGTVAQRNAETNQIDVVSKPDARAGTGVTPLSAGEAAKVRRDFKETKDALNTFKAFDQALESVPNGAGLLLDGNQKGRLGTAYNNARAALRIVYNTGVLQPGELPMLESALRDPTSFQAVLDPRTRPQIQAQLDELYRSIATGIENQVASYPQIFDPQKYDAFKQSKQAPQGGPKIGDVEDGYRFKGGNKADPNSWEKV